MDNTEIIMWILVLGILVLNIVALHLANRYSLPSYKVDVPGDYIYSSFGLGTCYVSTYFFELLIVAVGLVLALSLYRLLRSEKKLIPGGLFAVNAVMFLVLLVPYLTTESIQFNQYLADQQCTDGYVQCKDELCERKCGDEKCFECEDKEGVMKCTKGSMQSCSVEGHCMRKFGINIAAFTGFWNFVLVVNILQMVYCRAI
jgi:hypothetical protein